MKLKAPTIHSAHVLKIADFIALIALVDVVNLLAARPSVTQDS